VLDLVAEAFDFSTAARRSTMSDMDISLTVEELETSDADPDETVVGALPNALDDYALTKVFGSIRNCKDVGKLASTSYQMSEFAKSNIAAIYDTLSQSMPRTYPRRPVGATLTWNEFGMLCHAMSAYDAFTTAYEADQRAGPNLYAMPHAKPLPWPATFAGAMLFAANVAVLESIPNNPPSRDQQPLQGAGQEFATCSRALELGDGLAELAFLGTASAAAYRGRQRLSPFEIDNLTRLCSRLSPRRAHWVRETAEIGPAIGVAPILVGHDLGIFGSTRARQCLVEVLSSDALTLQGHRPAWAAMALAYHVSRSDESVANVSESQVLHQISDDDLLVHPSRAGKLFKQLQTQGWTTSIVKRAMHDADDSDNSDVE
jgi:hypothetical protein